MIKDANPFYQPTKHLSTKPSHENQYHRIAIACGGCGAIETMVADKDQSYLRDYTCDVCKKKLVVRTDPDGGDHGAYVCTDDAGYKAKLLTAF